MSLRSNSYSRSNGVLEQSQGFSGGSSRNHFECRIYGSGQVRWTVFAHQGSTRGDWAPLLESTICQCNANNQRLRATTKSRMCGTSPAQDFVNADVMPKYGVGSDRM